MASFPGAITAQGAASEPPLTPGNHIASCHCCAARPPSAVMPGSSGPRLLDSPESLPPPCPPPLTCCRGPLTPSRPPVHPQHGARPRLVTRPLAEAKARHPDLPRPLPASTHRSGHRVTFAWAHTPVTLGLGILPSAPASSSHLLKEPGEVDCPVSPQRPPGRAWSTWGRGNSLRAAQHRPWLDVSPGGEAPRDPCCHPIPGQLCGRLSLEKAR